MLRKTAVFAMQGASYAAGIIAIFSLLPILNYIANGLIALYTLRMGPKEGIKVVVFATLIFTAIAVLLIGKTTIPAIYLLSNWLPILVVSLVLGYTRSLSASVLTAGGMGILFVIGVYLFVPDPALWWQQIITPFWELISQQDGWSASPEKTQEMMVLLSKLMTGLIAASITINAIVGVIIGRALQAKLYNPGGFAGEFQQLRLGKPAAVLAIGLMVITILPLSNQFAWLQECLTTVLVVFALQGLAVAHAIVKNQQKASFWLVAI